MAVMNRLSPLITRRVGRSAAAAAPMPSSWFEERVEADGGERMFEDLKLFATGWVGGLIFFGTLIG
jgi:hypothetical protein